MEAVRATRTAKIGTWDEKQRSRLTAYYVPLGDARWRKPLGQLADKEQDTDNIAQTKGRNAVEETLSKDQDRKTERTVRHILRTRTEYHVARKQCPQVFPPD